ncbi:MAG: electron transfer flavoprotein subunit alpha/FixB family protein [Anaerolineales bacterium]|nr:electron transfer flavoprotein subunit alpha/FixB family protein [Anaerolineales bacterium]
MAKLLVYSEEAGVARELLAKARQVAGTQGFTEVGVVALGAAAAATAAIWGEWGADVVYTVAEPALDVYNPETYTAALAGVIEQVQPVVVLVGATKRGLEVNGRVAERLGAGAVSWCDDFSYDAASQSVTAKCLVYTGIGNNTYRINVLPALAAVPPGVFHEQAFAGHSAAVIAVPVAIPAARMRVLANSVKADTGRRLQDAPVIVDVGQGMRNREDLAMAEELAGLLNGQVACSRPISSERDWFPEWLGLSGLKLSPDLCITLGVSGSIQHTIGIRESKLIVAVNSDENAGIFAQADYGIHADLYQFVPALIEAIKTRSVTKK